MDTVSTGNLLEVNGARIYHEVRGSGPSVLFMAGATGDGGHFRRVAEILSDEFTVVTYDRRANSRSPRPEGWESTSTEEQSEDAAGLIEALGIAPAAIFGNSAGAIIGLDLVIRRPELVRRRGRGPVTARCQLQLSGRPCTSNPMCCSMRDADRRTSEKAVTPMLAR